MARGFTGIRLLLVFVGVNTIMFAILVTSMVSEHPWLARVLPGQFGVGVNSSGYWVFFSLVLLVNAITVLLAGFALVLPALTNGGPLNEHRLMRLLANRSGVDDNARESCVVAVREDAAATRQMVALGRAILISGIVFLTVAFMALTYSTTRAIPYGHLFADHTGAIVNSAVSFDTVWKFTADQIADTLLLGTPEIYHRHFIHVVNNIEDPFYSSFVLAYRTFVGLIALIVVLTLLRARGWRPEKAKVAPAPAVAKAEHKD
ncbi:MAG: hypothetical protein ABSD74_16450 [Rhizomicrobium sp.]